ncbi:MAG: SCO family protein [Litorimonas sp.]
MRAIKIPSLLLAVILSIPVLGLSACNNTKDTEAGRSGRAVTSGTADIGGPFELIDQDGAVVTETSLLGKPHMVYFGFTFCPDICPTALQKMGAAQDLLGAQGDDIGYVLTSIDPERDTPDALKQYITASVFPTGLRGYTGSLDQIEVAKKAYKVYATKAELEGSAGDYTVDHSDIIYFMDKDGKFVDYFISRTTPKDMAVRIRYHLKTGK